MAGAGQPFYMPLTWPVGHVLSAVSKPENEKVSSPAAMPALDMIGHATSMIAATRSFLMAYLCMFVLYSGSDYPAFGRAKTYELEWIVPIIARDLIATWLIAGMWDWYVSCSALSFARDSHSHSLTLPPCAHSPSFVSAGFSTSARSERSSTNTSSIPTTLALLR